MKVLRTYGKTAKSAAAAIEAIERRGSVNTAKVEAVVSTILADVRQGGDEAVLEYAGRFDGLKQEDGSLLALRVAREEMEAAWAETAPELQEAMRVAQANIKAFAEAQLPKEWTTEPVAGVKTGQIVRRWGAWGAMCRVEGIRCRARC